MKRLSLPPPPENHLRAFKCACGSATLLERVYCPRCRDVLKPTTVPNTGVVLSWTVIAVPAQGFETPVGLALVGLDCGINTVANFDPEEIPNPGQSVHIRVDSQTGRRWISFP
ncbi:MAG: hypothetical protein D6679_01175 [Candidatus Hydrogenedentota bacterium]|nr:MAG: hypothetical protein D6679_01175 [Candidatus Hydrogenedentota bacterium]